MKTMSSILPVLAISFLAMSIQAMPLGLRTAMWHVSSANNRSAVAKLLPEDCLESEIPAVLEPFADWALGGYITNKTEYADFREWAINSGANVEDLTSSQTAWMSFALNATGLMAAVKNGDLKIDSIEPSDVAGGFDIVFSLAHADVGRSAIEARLKALFEVEGATALSPDDGKTVDDLFSSDNIGLSLVPTGDGRVKATVSPPAGADNLFFMRVKLK